MELKVKINHAREVQHNNRLTLETQIKYSKGVINNLKLILNGLALARKNKSFVLK